MLDDSLDSTDGVQQYILTLGKWLACQNHEVHYLVGGTKRTDITNVHSLARNLTVKFNRNVLSIPTHSNKKQIKQLLKDQQFDILHVQLPFSPVLAGRIINLAPAKTRIVGTFHILPYSKLQFIGTQILHWITNKSIKRFDKIISVSPAAKSFAKTAMGIESQVIPNAVDFTSFKVSSTKNNDSNIRIVFLGRLVQRKGCMELLKAIDLLISNQKSLNLQVVIAGDGPDRKKLEQYVVAHNLAEIIEFRGRISEEEKPKLLSSAEIVALPSISGESFGIVVVEAIASGGGVVVGGKNPGYSFVLAKTPEVLFVPQDTVEFARLLLELLHSEEKRKKLARIQKEAIKDFDVEVVGKQILEVYQSVIAKVN